MSGKGEEIGMSEVVEGEEEYTSHNRSCNTRRRDGCGGEIKT